MTQRSSTAWGIAEATAGVIGSVEYDAAAAAGRPTASPKSTGRVYRQSVIFGRTSILTEGDANALPQNAEVAARLAVGTLKAYRDIAL
jgi:hypothetical protein